VEGMGLFLPFQIFYVIQISPNAKLKEGKENLTRDQKVKRQGSPSRQSQCIIRKKVLSLSLSSRYFHWLVRFIFGSMCPEATSDLIF
jgi:hypothetical protein